jgi:hypothetical protein
MVSYHLAACEGCRGMSSPLAFLLYRIKTMTGLEERKKKGKQTRRATEDNDVTSFRRKTILLATQTQAARLLVNAFEGEEKLRM